MAVWLIDSLGNTTEKNMEYTIVESLDSCELARTVNEFMAHGWRPQGGACALVIPAGGAGMLYSADEDCPSILYAQAMIHDVSGAFTPGVDGTGYEVPNA
jgi:hypothetical protein